MTDEKVKKLEQEKKTLFDNLQLAVKQNEELTAKLKQTKQEKDELRVCLGKQATENVRLKAKAESWEEEAVALTDELDRVNKAVKEYGRSGVVDRCIGCDTERCETSTCESSI